MVRAGIWAVPKGCPPPTEVCKHLGVHAGAALHRHPYSKAMPEATIKGYLGGTIEKITFIKKSYHTLHIKKYSSPRVEIRETVNKGG